MTRLRKTYNKGSCVEVESDDLLSVAKLVESSLRRTGGKQAIYENSENGLQQFMERATDFFRYINEVNADPNLEKKLLPDIENLCVYLGITRKTLSMYHRRNDQWAQAIDLAKDGIMACKKQLAATGRMPPLIFVFDATNNHGYISTSEFHLVAEAQTNEQKPQIDSAQLDRIATTAADTAEALALPPPQMPYE